MTNREHDTVSVGRRRSGAGWFVAVLLLIVIAGGGLYLYNSGALDGQKDINVNIETPTVPETPAAPEAPTVPDAN